MWIKNKIMFLLIANPLIFGFSGCSFPENKAEVPVFNKSNPAEESASVAKRFKEPASGNQTVIESAIELSEKYAKLSNEAALLKNKNEQLTAENKQLKEKLASVEAKLKQTQKELTEANELLIEMRIELNNWKTNVLGFREEIREAETEQLKALLKILQILGGEVNTDSEKSNNTVKDSNNLDIKADSAPKNTLNSDR